jgi:hypothetical protein
LPDPRRKLVELKQGDALYFSPMLAQIEGVNVQRERVDHAVRARPRPDRGLGSVILDVEPDCETSLEVEVEDLPAATYDLYRRRAHWSARSR